LYSQDNNFGEANAINFLCHSSGKRWAALVGLTGGGGFYSISVWAASEACHTPRPACPLLRPYVFTQSGRLAIYHDLFARIKKQFLSLPDFAFLLFHVLNSAPLIRIEHSFLFL
jgi:hypothetical protein